MNIKGLYNYYCYFFLEPLNDFIIKKKSGLTLSIINYITLVLIQNFGIYSLYTLGNLLELQLAYHNYLLYTEVVKFR